MRNHQPKLFRGCALNRGEKRHYTFSKMKHYQRNNKSKFRKKRANLAVEIGGNVFIKENEPDRCYSKMVSAASNKIKNNARTVSTTKKYDYYIVCKPQNPFWEILTVNGVVISDSRSTQGSIIQIVCK